MYIDYEYEYDYGSDYDSDYHFEFILKRNSIRFQRLGPTARADG